MTNRFMATTTDQHVGSRVRMRRMMLGVSQTDLGKALGVTFQQVQKYEKGASRIGAGRLHQISHRLQVPVEFFFEGAPDMHTPVGEMKQPSTPEYVTALVTSFEGLALAKAFTSIRRPALRTRIVKLVEDIADARD
jgi:transcriptional regulator with XRE-family HTH domain